MFMFELFKNQSRLRIIVLCLLVTYMLLAINLIAIQRLQNPNYSWNYNTFYKHMLNRQEVVVSDLEQRKHTDQHTQSDMDEIQSDMDEIQSDMDEIQSDMDETQSDMDETQSDMDENITTDNMQSMKYIITNNTAHLDIELYEKRLKQGNSVKLDFIPNVPEYTTFDTIPFLSDNITSMFLTLPNIEYAHKIAILTPVRDAEIRIMNYVQEISNLTYPHRLISLYLGEDSSSDGTYQAAENATRLIKEIHCFNDSEMFRFDISGGVSGNWGHMHAVSSQKKRRSHMAKARNLLLETSLRKGNFDYILWIDSDFQTLPHDLVQQMIFAGADVTVASCVYMNDKIKRNYDKNSWRETSKSIKYQSTLQSSVLVLEGYYPTSRLMLPDLKGEGRIVDLDGVGACSLLVKADCHRNGLRFPEVLYKHHIESEGLAKMAKNMGYTVVGLPYLEVVHS